MNYNPDEWDKRTILLGHIPLLSQISAPGQVPQHIALTLASKDHDFEVALDPVSFGHG